MTLDQAAEHLEALILSFVSQSPVGKEHSAQLGAHSKSSTNVSGYSPCLPVGRADENASKRDKSRGKETSDQ